MLQWILIGLAGLVVLPICCGSWSQPIARIRLAKTDKDEADDEEAWTPDRDSALALLDDADRLRRPKGASTRRPACCSQRSVGQIAAARPDWLAPSSTVREIAALPALPERARGAFTAIAERVERSLFALRRLNTEGVGRRRAPPMPIVRAARPEAEPGMSAQTASAGASPFSPRAVLGLLVIGAAC